MLSPGATKHPGTQLQALPEGLKFSPMCQVGLSSLISAGLSVLFLGSFKTALIIYFYFFKE